MNDELDFREFLGLYDLMDIKEKLFEFTLYNPDSDLEYDFISVEEKNVSYVDQDHNKITKQIYDLQELKVICPENSKILTSKIKFDDYKNFKFSVSHSGKLPSLKYSDFKLKKYFEVEVIIDIETSLIELKEIVDDFILSEKSLMFSMSSKKENYLGFEIFHFEHIKSDKLIARKIESFSEYIIIENISESGTTRLFNKIDSVVLSSIKHFKLCSDKIEDFLNCQSMYIKTIDGHHFKSFLQNEIIVETSGNKDFETIKSLHFKKVEDYCVKRAFEDDSFLNLISEEKSYGGVLIAQFFNFSDKHFIRINLDDLEVFSEIGDGNAEQKIRLQIDKIKENYASKIKEIFERNHKKYKLATLGPQASSSISYKAQPYNRFTHCWKCKNYIDSLNFYTCNECSGIVCFCGACFCSNTGY